MRGPAHKELSKGAGEGAAFIAAEGPEGQAGSSCHEESA